MCQQKKPEKAATKRQLLIYAWDKPPVTAQAHDKPDNNNRKPTIKKPSRIKMSCSADKLPVL
jgi:hypothetical protein